MGRGNAQNKKAQNEEVKHDKCPYSLFRDKIPQSQTTCSTRNTSDPGTRKMPPCGVAVRAWSGPISMRDSRQPLMKPISQTILNRRINHLTLPSVNGPPKFKGQGIPLWWFDAPKTHTRAWHRPNQRDMTCESK